MRVPLSDRERSLRIVETWPHPSESLQQRCRLGLWAVWRDFYRRPRPGYRPRRFLDWEQQVQTRDPYTTYEYATGYLLRDPIGDRWFQVEETSAEWFDIESLHRTPIGVPEMRGSYQRQWVVTQGPIQYRGWSHSWRSSLLSPQPISIQMSSWMHHVEGCSSLGLTALEQTFWLDEWTPVVDVATRTIHFREYPPLVIPRSVGDVQIGPSFATWVPRLPRGYHWDDPLSLLHPEGVIGPMITWDPEIFQPGVPVLVEDRGDVRAYRVDPSHVASSDPG